MKLKIFYSWQATTNPRYNRNFIYSCIEKAIKKLKNKPEFSDVDFLLLEGVRDIPGSPPVASVIIDERIPNCDIFIADLSVVNYINSFQRFARFLLQDKFKPFQNNNVINEHGVARNALTDAKIIGVLNSAYGSPNDNPENIPFDLRHTRFPIEYNYSKKTKNKDEIQSKLINSLVAAIKDVSIYSLTYRKNKFNPLIVWSEWEKITNIKQAYIPNKKQQK